LIILAKNMRRLRAKSGLTQEALAHDCGINASTSAVLSDQSEMSQSTTRYRALEIAKKDD
jgi:transcriptional regulator with XRE-family HTH domain